MKTKFIEATHPGDRGNWGKFMVAKFTDEEWARKSAVCPSDGVIWGGGPSFLAGRGHSRTDVLVVDLQTCEGAIFGPHGLALADLNKHKIWTCPLFEAFLPWVYAQDLSDLDALPDKVELDAEFAFAGYRREGGVVFDGIPKSLPRWSVILCLGCGRVARILQTEREVLDVRCWKVESFEKHPTGWCSACVESPSAGTLGPGDVQAT